MPRSYKVLAKDSKIGRANKRGKKIISTKSSCLISMAINNKKIKNKNERLKKKPL